MPLTVVWNFTDLPARRAARSSRGRRLRNPSRRLETAAQVFGERGEGLGPGDFEHHLLLLHRLAFHSGDALERHHGVVAVNERARVDIGVIGLLLADLLDPFGNVLVHDLGS